MTAHEDINKTNSANKTTKKTTSSEKHLMPEIEMPSDETWDQEFKVFNFTEAQDIELRNTIRHIAEDIIAYNKIMRKIGPRSELKRRLLAFEKALAKTRYYAEAFEEGMDDWMPLDSLEQIGLLSNFLKAEEIHGGKTYSARVNQDIQKASFSGSPLSIEQIGEKLDVSLQSLGLLSGHKIFKHFIQKVHDPIKKWVEIEQSNKGGAPAQKTTRHVIYWLAWSAPEIIGSEAAVSKDGPFVRLCAAVLSACGHPSDSVENIAPKIVKKALADKKKYLEEMEGKSVTFCAIP